MPRAKKTTKTVEAKNILSELTPEEKASFVSGFESRGDWGDDDDDYSEDYEPVPTYANGFDPKNLAVNPITGTSKQTPSPNMSNFLPGMGPNLSSTPTEEIAKSYPETKKNYDSMLEVYITFEQNTDVIKIAELLNKLRAVIDSSNNVQMASFNFDTNYFKSNEGYEPIAK